MKFFISRVRIPFSPNLSYVPFTAYVSGQPLAGNALMLHRSSVTNLVFGLEKYLLSLATLEPSFSDGRCFVLCSLWPALRLDQEWHSTKPNSVFIQIGLSGTVKFWTVNSDFYMNSPFKIFLHRKKTDLIKKQKLMDLESIDWLR